MHACICMCVFVFRCVYVCTDMYVCVCLYIGMYVAVCVFVRACVSVFVYRQKPEATSGAIFRHFLPFPLRQSPLLNLNFVLG